MAEENSTSSISNARTYEEMGEFWDTHSLADYEDQTYEVAMAFSPAARRTYVNIEPDLMEDLWAIAQERRISAETLINVWLRRQVDEVRLRVAA
jgi:hypothetical protein